MTMIRLHDIRENDVHESAGMSNIPWEYEYGFQLLDGLSPDADGTFFTNVYVRRKDGTIRVVQYNRLQLIKLANKILLDAAVEIAFAIQRETLLPGPDLVVSYEMCPSAGVTKALVIDDLAFPISQVLSLRGYDGVGKLQWVDPPDEC